MPNQKHKEPPGSALVGSFAQDRLHPLDSRIETLVLIFEATELLGNNALVCTGRPLAALSSKRLNSLRAISEDG